jgi:membrane-bound lytic murein transglycosylase D
MTIMAKNPGDYGLDKIAEDDPLTYDEIRIDAPTSVELIADAAQQPVSFIRDMNPALLKSIAPAGFDLHVPKGDGETTEAAIGTVPASNRNSWRLHHVSQGETLDAIARAYHVTADRIIQVNNGADSLDAGDMLLIPAVYHPPVVTRTRATRSSKGRTRSSHVSTTSHLAKRPASHISASVLHRKATVKTASLNR